LSVPLRFFRAPLHRYYSSSWINTRILFRSERKMPHLARSFQQIVDIRTGECEQDHYIDFERLTTKSKRVNTAINKQKRLSISSHGVLWGSRVQFFEYSR
jgi:hypothetical protein